MNVPEIADKINDLYYTVKQTNTSPNEIATKINSILIYGDGISTDILKPAWDYFMEKKGLGNAKKILGGSNLEQ